VSFGSALVDLDGDGDLDLVLANYDAPPSIFRNDMVSGHSLEIKLDGRAPTLDGIGAEIRIESASGIQVRQVFTERGIVASEPALTHFGLGSDTKVNKLTIRWPRGQIQVLENLPTNRLFTVKEPALPEGKKPTLPPAIFTTPPNPRALMTETAVSRGLKHANALRPFDEFTRQRLLPRRLNGMGPALATADVNGDGIPDIFVSGTAGEKGELFLGQADGTFKSAPNQPWADAVAADDVGAAFFDANGDGAVDLFIAAGGVEHSPGDALLNDRLYLGDGHGKFTLASADVLPADGESTCAVAAADFDGDQKTDLFVGGRVVPGKYPATPRSFLYHNVGGKFVDVTNELAPGLREIGMVTAAAWADIDGDKRPDLVLALEWGAITYFHNTGHGFENLTEKAGLAARTGWWSALTIADVNADGRLDLIVGNVGLNTKYHASAAEPTLLFAGDFEGNNKEQLIEAEYDHGGIYPLRGRSKLGYAFPWLAKKFPTYKVYAKAQITDIFSPERLASVRRLAATELASGIYLQLTDHTFSFAPLPRTAQIAPINAILAQDFDADGKIDLYCVGNNFGPEPTTGRFDGGLGVLLKGDGHGNFLPESPRDSGIVVQGDARSAISFQDVVTKRPAVVVSRCDGPLLLFTTQK